MTAPAEDRVALARERAILFPSEWNVDALIVAVREQTRAEIRGKVEAIGRLAIDSVAHPKVAHLDLCHRSDILAALSGAEKTHTKD